MRDLYSKLKAASAIAPALRTTSVNGTGIDRQGFEAVLFTFLPGAITDGTHTPSIEESDDNSTYTTVAAANLLGTLTALAANTPQKVGYIGGKRYTRGVVTVTGSPATGGTIGATVHLGAAALQPVA